jgi:hypothetical protein
MTKPSNTPMGMVEEIFNLNVLVIIGIDPKLHPLGFKTLILPSSQLGLFGTSQTLKQPFFVCSTELLAIWVGTNDIHFNVR